MTDYDCPGLNEMRDRVHATAVEKGWWDPQVVGVDESHNEITAQRTFGDLIALVHSEASEALEEHRNGHEPTKIYYSGGSETSSTRYENWPTNITGQLKSEGVPSELADVIIRVLDMCGWYGIDIEGAVAEKIAYNATRPHRHGGKAL